MGAYTTKPCRKCGEKPVLTKLDGKYMAICANEACKSQPYTALAATKKAAVQAWNAGHLRFSKGEEIKPKDVIDVEEAVREVRKEQLKMSKEDRYSHGGLECIDMISQSMSDEQYKGFCSGNVYKYLYRYEHKGGIEDLVKCIDYVMYLIEANVDKKNPYPSEQIDDIVVKHIDRVDKD